MSSRSCDTCTRTAPILQIASKMQFTKPLEARRDGSITTPCTQEVVTRVRERRRLHVRVQKLCNGTDRERLELSTIFAWFRPSCQKFRHPRSATRVESRAIDLSCRACGACGAMAMGAGLGFPVGALPLRSRFTPPTSDLWLHPECSPGGT